MTNLPEANLAHRLPLLVTGIAGVAGYNAFRHFRHRYPGQVVGIRPHQTFRLKGDGVVALDAEDRDGLAALFDRYRFKSVLNTTGNCALKSCELDPAMAHALNVASVANVALNCKLSGARLVHLSSDLVFSGARRGVSPPCPYVETDATDPVTVYGKTMVLGEEVIGNAAPAAAILRISLPMGPSFNRHAGAIDWIQSRFRAGRPATLYFDEVRSATYCVDLNRVFAWFLANEVPGLYHCGGPRPVTLYQIGQIVNRVGGYEPHLLRGCPRREAGPIPPRAGNVGMNSGKLLTLLGGQPFHPWPRGPRDWPSDRDWHWARTVDDWSGPTALVHRLYAYHAQPASAGAQS
jgi:dTDP-4-dehydrorhamnose reductase